jgi:hypothetical protein
MSSKPPAGWGAWEFACDYKNGAHKEGVENGRSTEYGELRIHLRVLPAQKKRESLAAIG